jgi:hypothetical protein
MVVWDQLERQKLPFSLAVNKQRGKRSKEPVTMSVLQDPAKGEKHQLIALAGAIRSNSVSDLEYGSIKPSNSWMVGGRGDDGVGPAQILTSLVEMDEGLQ